MCKISGPCLCDDRYHRVSPELFLGGLLDISPDFSMISTDCAVHHAHFRSPKHFRGDFLEMPLLSAQEHRKKLQFLMSEYQTTENKNKASDRR